MVSEDISAHPPQKSAVRPGSGAPAGKAGIPALPILHKTEKRLAGATHGRAYLSPPGHGNRRGPRGDWNRLARPKDSHACTTTATCSQITDNERPREQSRMGVIHQLIQTARRSEPTSALWRIEKSGTPGSASPVHKCRGDDSRKDDGDGRDGDAQPRRHRFAATRRLLVRLTQAWPWPNESSDDEQTPPAIRTDFVESSSRPHNVNARRGDSI